MTRVNFAGAGEYNGPTVARAQLAPWQGPTFGDITEIVEGLSGKGNVTLDMTMTIKEEGGVGVNVRKVQAISGEMGGKRKGVPNITGLFDIYFSAYTGAVDEDEAKKLVQNLQGQDMDTADIIADLKGKRVWFRLKAEEATNKTTGEKYLVSGVDNFISRQAFEDLAETGRHHIDNPPAPSNAMDDRPNGVVGGAPAAGRSGARI